MCFWVMVWVSVKRLKTIKKKDCNRCCINKMQLNILEISFSGELLVSILSF